MGSKKKKKKIEAIKYINHMKLAHLSFKVHVWPELREFNDYAKTLDK
jgi:hypothetical protein